MQPRLVRAEAASAHEVIQRNLSRYPEHAGEPMQGVWRSTNGRTPTVHHTCAPPHFSTIARNTLYSTHLSASREHKPSARLEFLSR